MWYAVLILIIFSMFSYVFRILYNDGANKIKFYLKISIFPIWTFLVTAVVWPFFILRPKNVKNAKQTANILKHVIKLNGIKWHLRDGNILSEDRGAVIIANHQSSLDVLGVINIWDVADKLTIVSKKQLFYVWPFGLSAYLSGIIFIDRCDSKKAYKELENATKVMVRNKTKIWVFPEGTRNKNTKNFLPFKKGAFIMAVTAQVPIIPVVFSPYYFINSDKYIFNKGEMIIQCLEPIATAGLTMEDIPNLIKQTSDKMFEVYKTLSKKVLNKIPPD